MNSQDARSEYLILKRFAEYVFRYKARLFYAIGCSLLITVLTLMMLMLLKPVSETIFPNPAKQVSKTEIVNQSSGMVDRILGFNLVDTLLGPVDNMIDRFAQANPLAALGVISVCILFIVTLNGIFRYIQEYMVKWIGNRVILDLQRDLFDRMIHFNTAFFAKNRVGFLISYYTVDTRVIGLTVFNVFGRMLLDPIMLLGYLTALFLMQWKLTLLYMIVIPFIFMTIRYFARKNRKAGRQTQDITARMGSFLQEHLSHIRLVQGYEMYDRQRRCFGNEARGVFDAGMKMARAIAASSPINELIGIFAFCCILMLGGYMLFVVHDTSFESGDFVVFISVLVSMYQPIKRIENTIQQIQHGLAAAERVFSVLDTDAILPEKESAFDLKSFREEIRFKNVGFAYIKDIPVLQDVSFSVRKGERVAFVGPSGAGKSTLVNLIPRFYDPETGSITIDGHDLRDIDLKSLRRAISLVHQDVMILGDSVRLNLTCGDESYTEDKIVAAAKAAHAHEFISALPNGYDSILGERGESLSGGQCQRIALARAFLRDAPILILDEATSSLDSESERHIKDSLQELMKGRTTLVIAHRFSTVLKSDQIVVLDAGRIVDSGPHADLLDRCDLYRRLYRLQFSDDSVANTKPE